MKIIIEPAALAELKDSQDYYRTHASPRIAAAFMSEIESGIERLRSYPEVGTPISKRLRTLPLQKFPYSLIYHFNTETLTILAVAPQRRRPGYWAGRR
jgi:plasmid stabilization system protein ParE